MSTRHAIPFALVFFALCLFGPAVFAQDTTHTSSNIVSSGRAATCTFSIGPFMSPSEGPQSAVPYSATEETSHLQTLADGTHISQKPLPLKVYRDSQGRTRRDQAFCARAFNDDSSAALVVIIRDPVEGVSYVLDTQNHIAHRFTATADSKPQIASSASLPRAPASASGVAVFSSNASTGTLSGVTSSTNQAMSVETENLGTQVIEGVSVEGKRTTRTIPINAEGNDQPIKMVTEIWYSPELKITVASKNSDPRTGERNFRLLEISLSEPDPALFRPPADYKVVDDTGSVRLEFNR